MVEAKSCNIDWVEYKGKQYRCYNGDVYEMLFNKIDDRDIPVEVKQHYKNRYVPSFDRINNHFRRMGV